LLDKSNKHLFVADLGIDKISIYPFDPDTGNIDVAGVRQIPCQPGAGPRHIVLAPDEKFLYAIHELNSTISCYQYDNFTGNYNEIHSVSTLPDEFRDPNTCAEIMIHPSGKYLYGSNRGHDSIAVYSRDSKHGLLNLIEIVPTGGQNPRNFTLSPDGKYLLAANQGSNNIVSFRLDPGTGKLQKLDHILEIPTPVCLLFS